MPIIKQPLSPPSQPITTTTFSITEKDRKIDEATLKLPKSCVKSLHSVTSESAVTIADYIIAMKSEVNLSDSYRTDNVSDGLLTIPKYEEVLADHSRHIIESDESIKPLLKEIEELAKEDNDSNH